MADSAKSIEQGEIAETVDLVKAYVVQETLGPLRGFARKIGLGIGGAVTVGVGLFFLSLGLLRLLQTHLTSLSSGSWSWVVYLIVVLFAGLVSGLALWRVAKIEKELT